MAPTGVERHRWSNPRGQRASVWEHASQHAGLGNRRVDGQTREGSGSANGSLRINGASWEAATNAEAQSGPSRRAGFSRLLFAPPCAQEVREVSGGDRELVRKLLPTTSAYP